jgi:hypothetical protein
MYSIRSSISLQSEQNSVSLKLYFARKDFMKQVYYYLEEKERKESFWR